MNTATTSAPPQVTLQQLVREYCELENQAQSKYFPLTEKALEMFERNLNAKQVRKEFMSAFCEVNGITSNKIDNADYVNFNSRVHQFTLIAERGRPFYDEQRKKRLGFHAMCELARAYKSKKSSGSEAEEHEDNGSGNGETPASDDGFFINKFCRQVTRDGQKCLKFKFFTNLAVLTDSVEKGQIENPEKYSEVVAILKKLVAVSQAALAKLEHEA
jgi:hypothetical protein